MRTVAAPLLRIVAFAMPPLALLNVMTGALRGAGDTRWPLAFSLIGFLLVRMPLAWLLAHSLGLGVPGAWYAMLIDLSLRSAMLTLRFAHGGWKQIEL